MTESGNFLALCVKAVIFQPNRIFLRESGNFLFSCVKAVISLNVIMVELIFAFMYELLEYEWYMRKPYVRKLLFLS